MVQRVLIGWTTQESGRRADFYNYLSTLNKPPGTYHMPSNDRSPAKGRNLIIEEAMKKECSHILFVDDDMAPQPDALLQLLEHNVPAVSGLYLSRRYPHEPLAFDVADDSGACLPMYLLGNEKRLMPIVAAGLGFCLFKIEVFETMRKPWIRLGELDQEEWCDDIGFFKRFREAGFQLYLDTECLVGHIGSMIIKPNKEKGEWFTNYDTAGKGMIKTPQLIKSGMLQEK